MKRRTKKRIKKIAIIVGIITVIVLGLIVAVAIDELQQEEILKQELINYSNKDLNTDDFTIEVKTKGDYAYVEEAVKKYYKELSDNSKQLNLYLNNDKIANILSVENLESDRPDYTISRSLIKKTKYKVNKALSNINKLCEEKTIKKLIDKEKLDDGEYYYDLYLSLMYTEKDKKEFKELKKDVTKISEDINKNLDKLDEILVFLQKNDSIIEYKNNTLYFNSEAKLKEYKTLISELDEIETQNQNDSKNKL